MPFIHRLPDRLPDLLGSGTQYAPRTGSPSAHVSAIVKSICADLNPKRFGAQRGEGYEDITEATRNRWEVGLAFEDVLGRVLADRFLAAQSVKWIGAKQTGAAFKSTPPGTPARYQRPGEYIDPATGIIGTPDVIDVVDKVVEEWKSTWMSCRLTGGPGTELLDSPKFWHWLVQLQAYLYLTKLTTGRIRALFINGDYDRSKEGGGGPEFHTYELVFRQREIDENWAMMVAHARAKGMLGKGKGGGR